jgi:peptidoglycan hydrolase CwlO-like protein
MSIRDRAITLVERVSVWIGSVASLVAHTILFAAVFAVGFFGIAPWEIVMLLLTTVVSLEAIYLAIFIQMSVNRNTESLREVEEDIDEIQEDVEELGEDIDEIQEDIEDIQEDVEEMAEEEEAPKTLDDLTTDIRRVLADLEALKARK